MARNGFKTLNGSIGLTGLNGRPGDAALGGKNGDSARRGFFIRTMLLASALTSGIASAADRHYFDQEYDYTVPSELRGLPGLVLEELNSEGIQQSNQSILEFYDRETDYLKFIIDINSEFMYSSLIERKFCSNLIQASYFQPSLEKLIDRFYLVNKYNTKHLLNEVKKEIVDLFNRTNLTRDDQLALNYTYTAISSAIYRFESLDQTALVVDLKSYLELTIEQIREWKSLAKQDVRQVYRKNYENNLKSKIDEATGLVNVLTKDIEDHELKMNKVIKDIVGELKEMQKSAFKNDSILVEQKRQLEKSVLLKKIFGVVKIACQVLSFLGPEAKLAGSLIETGIGVADMFVPDKFKLPEIKMNPGLSEAIKGVSNKIQKNKENKYNDIKEELKKLEKKVKNEIDLTVSERIDALPETIEKYELKKKYSNFVKKDTNDPKKIQEADEKIDDAEKKIEKLKNKVDFVQTGAQIINNAYDVAKEIKGLYDDFKKYDDEVEIMAQAVKANAENFNNLNTLEESIYKFENEIVKNLNNQLSDISKNLKGSSIASLELTRWKTKRLLEEFKEIVMQTMSFFGNNTQMITTINRIDGSFNTMINIYTKIESYMEQNDFASYIADVTQTELAIGIPVQYQSQINSLKKSIHSNIIMDRYNQAIEAFKYWSFPFFCQYTSDINVYLARENTFENTDELISNYADSLSKLLNKLKNYDTLLRPATDNIIQGFEFENEYSFFKWSSIKYPLESFSLLNGRKTTFDANLDDENSKLFDAVKFCTVYLTIESKNSTKNEMLNSVLRNFFVELTHSGNSRYKYNDKKYTIEMNFNSGEKLKLRYPYGSTDSNKANESFKKLSKNKPILSPYTQWDIQLVAINSQNQFKLFEELNSMISDQNEFVISLNGYGQYLISHENQIDPNLCEPNTASLFRNNKVPMRRIGWG